MSTYTCQVQHQEGYMYPHRESLQPHWEGEICISQERQDYAVVTTSPHNFNG